MVKRCALTRNWNAAAAIFSVFYVLELLFFLEVTTYGND